MQSKRKLRFIREEFNATTGKVIVVVRPSGSKVIEEWGYDLAGQKKRDAALARLQRKPLPKKPPPKKRKRFPRL